MTGSRIGSRRGLLNNNPGQPSLPWAPFNPDRCPTMILDNVCRMVDDPEAEARKILLA